MGRRFPIQQLAAGIVNLDMTQSRHVRDVLRLRAGAEVELFDSAGRSASARIVVTSPLVQLMVETLEEARPRVVRLTIAAAPPKGPRADWMIEKLSELDVARFIPLQSARTIVHPEAGKLARWERLASESAKQCRRQDVMQIAPPMTVDELCSSGVTGTKWCLSIEGEAAPVRACLQTLSAGDILAAIGPEGGWTDAELDAYRQFGFHLVTLTSTILRIETAAIAMAALVMTSAPAMTDKEQHT